MPAKERCPLYSMSAIDNGMTVYVNKREQWIAVPYTKTPMENTSDSNLKVTNHVPTLLSSHMSVTVNSGCVNTKNRKKQGKKEKTRHGFADACKTNFYADLVKGLRNYKNIKYKLPNKKGGVWKKPWVKDSCLIIGDYMILD